MEFLLGFGVGGSFGACLGLLVAVMLRASKDDALETRFTEPDGAALRKACRVAE
ncbi:hypothetical protein P3T25_008755 [Paraburkholderia sp. GAS32]|jgi:hypothetical protein